MMESEAASIQPYMNPQVAPRCFDVYPYPLIKCRIHPTVVLSILDAYVRRDPNQGRVIGTLLGTVSAKSYVDITDCFVDRHSLTGEGLLQIIKDHHELMYDMKQKVNPELQVVGWFCTGYEMTELTCAVNGWFRQVSSVSKFVPHPPLVEPIHLIVDTTLSSTEGLGLRTFLQVPMNLAKDACFQFHEIPLEINASGPDHAAVGTLVKHCRPLQMKKPQPDSGFAGTCKYLLEQLNECSAYVNRVLENEERPDIDFGRQLTKALSIDVASASDEADGSYLGVVQDHLMVSYLSTLARIQFALANKLSASFF